ncbi:hypothetical protein [Ruegeria arenilitoris]|uniref:hypothetical protein n=1 Tax=Ruegeria arenilitoris TaxID=1173585 RepID=UPI001479C935|nr:hypothetical protein [Ruegeria arenilitoris]
MRITIRAVVKVGNAQTVGSKCIENPARSGTITFDGQSVSFLVGYRRGTGVLTLENVQEFPFSARGIKVGETGVLSGHIQGEVIGLEELVNFNGHYKGGSGDALPLVGIGNLTLVNSQCVTIVAKCVAAGLKMSLPEDQVVTIQFLND